MMSQVASPLQQRLSRKDIQQARLKRLSDWMERLALRKSAADALLSVDADGGDSNAS